MAQIDMTPEEFLAHYGVKGMKWGVKKRYADKVGKKIARLDRVADGTASLRDKTQVHLTTRGVDIAAGGGLKGGAAVRSKREKEHLDRVMSGEKNAIDTLKFVGRLSIAEIAQGGRDKYRKG